MARRTRPKLRMGGRRQHGAVQHADRREMEREGWRTTLEYRENHVRGRDGRLRQLHVQWHAAAERVDDGGTLFVIAAQGSTSDKVWSRLRFEAEMTEVRVPSGVPGTAIAPA